MNGGIFVCVCVYLFVLHILMHFCVLYPKCSLFLTIALSNHIPEWERSGLKRDRRRKEVWNRAVYNVVLGIDQKNKENDSLTYLLVKKNEICLLS